jgi:hypothetical protein
LKNIATLRRRFFQCFVCAWQNDVAVRIDVTEHGGVSLKNALLTISGEFDFRFIERQRLMMSGIMAPIKIKPRHCGLLLLPRSVIGTYCAWRIATSPPGMADVIEAPHFIYGSQPASPIAFMKQHVKLNHHEEDHQGYALRDNADLLHQ